MLSERERVIFSDNDLLVREIIAEKLSHHHESLSRSNDLRVRVLLRKHLDIRRVIGLHMLYYQIIWRLTAENTFEITQPLIAEMRVYRIHDRDLLIKDNIRIIRHSVRHIVHTLKQIDLVVVNANVFDIIGNFHNLPP